MARPKGNGEGEWRAAIRHIVKERVSLGDGRFERRLYRLARRLVEAAESGEGWAFAEIGNRLDGRPAQAITGPQGGPIQIEALPAPELARRLAWVYAEALRQGGETLDLVPEPSGLLEADPNTTNVAVEDEKP